MDIGSDVWLPVEVNDTPYTLPKEYLESGLKPSFLPCRLRDANITEDKSSYTLDWDSSVTINSNHANAAVRDAEDEANAANPSVTTLALKHPSHASIASALEKRYNAGLPGVLLAGCFVWMNPIKEVTNRSDVPDIIKRCFEGSSSSSCVNGNRRRNSIMSATGNKYKGNDAMSLSVQAPLGEASSHVYHFMETVRKTLLQERRSQAVFMKGSSGSGKSELAKSALHYLLNVDAREKCICNQNCECIGSFFCNTVSNVAPSSPMTYPQLGSARNPLFLSDSRICKGVAASIRLLDSFGCASAESNKFCSRMIRHTKLVYGANNLIQGVTITPHLLESFPLSNASTKSKDNKKPYSILLMLLAGCVDRYEELRISPKQASVFFGYPATLIDTIKGDELLQKIKADPEVAELALEFLYLRQLLVAAGVPEPVFEEGVIALAVCIHLQSLVITTNSDFSAGAKVYRDHAEILLGVSAGSLGSVILKKIEMGAIVSDVKTFVDAKAACESLTLEIYQRTMDNFLGFCNARSGVTADVSPEASLSIDIVDMPGNELPIPHTGTLHQLGANYSAEKLLMHFADTVFGRAMHRYTIEGVVLDVEVPHYTTYVDFFENPKAGVIALMAEVSKLPKPEDKALLEKLMTANANTPAIMRSVPAGFKGRTTSQFLVVHSFGEAGYDSEGFMAIARSRITAPVTALLASSKLAIVARSLNYSSTTTFQPEATLDSESVKTAKKLTVFADKEEALNSLFFKRYKESLNTLFASLNFSETRYILCIRPSTDLLDPRFHPTYVTPQLRSLHILSLQQLSNSGFKAVLTLDEFFFRYREAIKPTGNSSVSEQLCKQLYKTILADACIPVPSSSDEPTKGVVFGSMGHVFVTAAMASLLDDYRDKMRAKWLNAARCMQSAVRMYRERGAYKRTLRVIALIQIAVRKFLALRRKKRTSKAGLKIHYFLIMLRQRFRFVSMKCAANFLKSRLMGKMVQRIRYKNLRNSIRLFTDFARGFVVRTQVARLLHAARTLQSKCRELLRIKKRNRIRCNAVIDLQRVSRGYVSRRLNRQVMDILAERRKDRLISKVIIKIQSRFRSKLVQARKVQLAEAALCLQYWTRGMQQRQQFLVKRKLACSLQKYVRRVLAVKRLHHLRAAVMLKLEAESFDKIRTIEIDKVRGKYHSAELKLGLGSCRQGHLRATRTLVGLEVSFDIIEAYPQGWVSSILRFSETIAKEKLVITKVAVGSQHTIILDDNDNVYSMGFGDGGQLGHGNRKSQMQPMRIAQIEHIIKTEIASDVAHKQKLSISSESLNSVKVALTIKDICCGADHTLLLTECGRVWSFGCNRKGQLGHGNFESSTYSRLVCLKAAATATGGPQTLKHIKQIACGGYFSACVTDSGILYTWGSTDCIGRPCQQPESAWPGIVPYFHYNIQGRMPIAQIACGDGHMIAKCAATVRNSRTGIELFAWGHNSLGQLGIGEVTKVRLWPTRVLLPTHTEKSKVEKNKYGSRAQKEIPTLLYNENDMNSAVLACGGRHTLLSLKGDVWAWGWNSLGQVGDGTQTNAFTPIKVHSATKEKGFAVSVSAGWQFSVALTYNKTVLLWGKSPLLGSPGAALQSSDGSPVHISFVPMLVDVSKSYGSGALHISTCSSNTMSVLCVDFIDNSVIQSASIRSSSPKKSPVSTATQALRRRSMSPNKSTHKIITKFGHSSVPVPMTQPSAFLGKTAARSLIDTSASSPNSPKRQYSSPLLPWFLMQSSLSPSAQVASQEEITERFRRLGNIHTAVREAGYASPEATADRKALYSKEAFTGIGTPSCSNSPKKPKVSHSIPVTRTDSPPGVARKRSSIFQINPPKILHKSASPINRRASINPRFWYGNSEEILQQPKKAVPAHREREKGFTDNSLVSLFKPLATHRETRAFSSGSSRRTMNLNVSYGDIFAAKRSSVFGVSNMWQLKLPSYKLPTALADSQNNLKGGDSPNRPISPFMLPVSHSPTKPSGSPPIFTDSVGEEYDFSPGPSRADSFVEPTAHHTAPPPSPSILSALFSYLGTEESEDVQAVSKQLTIEGAPTISEDALTVSKPVTIEGAPTISEDAPTVSDCVSMTTESIDLDDESTWKSVSESELDKLAGTEIKEQAYTLNLENELPEAIPLASAVDEPRIAGHNAGIVVVEDKQSPTLAPLVPPAPPPPSTRRDMHPNPPPPPLRSSSFASEASIPKVESISDPAELQSAPIPKRPSERLSEGLAKRMSGLDVSKLGLGALPRGSINSLKSKNESSSSPEASKEGGALDHESGFDFESRPSISENNSQDSEDGIRSSTISRVTLSSTTRSRATTRPAFRSSFTEELQEILKPDVTE